MKVFIYGFIAIYIGIISGKVFSFLFDKDINDITSNIDFEPITNSIIGAIIIYFVRLIFPKE
ncbi:hypothetical protein INT80_00730 [Gallibacterium anatis]|uniref:Uncharacterized protein n=1 Tax=Gallibacterium anatis TaxID=750 RepID=A0A930UVG2_9PAST|nr:hypothetical protein [Gallibacterium anatis]